MVGVGVLLLHSSPGGYAIIRGRFGRVAYASAIAGGAVVLGSQSVTATVVQNVTAGALTRALNGRQSAWTYAYAEFQRNHLFGYGPSLFSPAYRALLPAQLQYAGQAHNQIFQTLGEAGIVGFAGLLIYCLAVSVAATRCTARTEGLAWALVASLFVRMVGEAPLRNYGIDIGLFTHLTVVLVLIYGGALRAPWSRPTPAAAYHRPPRELAVV